MCCGAIWQYNLSDDKKRLLFHIHAASFILFCHLITLGCGGVGGANAAQWQHKKHSEALKTHTHGGSANCGTQQENFLCKICLVPPGILQRFATMLTGDFCRGVSVFVVATADVTIRIS